MFGCWFCGAQQQQYGRINGASINMMFKWWWLMTVIPIFAAPNIDLVLCVLSVYRYKLYIPFLLIFIYLLFCIVYLLFFFQTPQIILLTFDGAVNLNNFDKYKKVFNGKRKNPNGCDIRGTFFVAHEYRYAHQ